MAHDTDPATSRLQLAVDAARDHIRGGNESGAVSVVVYADFLCPYCRYLNVMVRLYGNWRYPSVQ